jgi:hypothetical protein
LDALQYRLLNSPQFPGSVQASHPVSIGCPEFASRQVGDVLTLNATVQSLRDRLLSVAAVLDVGTEAMPTLDPSIRRASERSA